MSFQRFGSILVSLSPWLTLVILFSYSFAWFVLFPHPGFSYDSEGIVEVLVDVDAGETLLKGDELLRVGEISVAERLRSRTAVWFAGYASGERVPIEVLRDGRQQLVMWTMPRLTPELLWNRMTNAWWLGYIFWLGGLVILLFVRPRDMTWRLLLWFHFFMAIFLSAGQLALQNVLGSAVIYPLAIWFLAAVTVHLHWVFPSPLTRLPAWLLSLWYGLTLVLALIDAIGPIQRGAQLPWLYLALAISLLILLFRLARRRQEDAGVVWLLVAVALVLLPSTIYTYFIWRGQAPPRLATGLGYLTLPALPGVYFYLASRAQLSPYRRQVRRAAVAYVGSMFLGFGLFTAISFLPGYSQGYEEQGALLVLLMLIIAALGVSPFLYLPAVFKASTSLSIPGVTRFQIRPNRLVGPYLFLLLLSICVIFLSTLARPWLLRPSLVVPASIGVTLATVLVARLSFQPFCRLVERRLLGIPVTPDLVATYATKLSTSSEPGQLAQLLVQRVLPNLMVRQSALLTFSETGTPSLLYAQDVPADEMERLSQRAMAVALIGQISREPQRMRNHSWANLAVPLWYQKRLIGLWLLGQRDPDDVYDRDTIAQCQALAEQTAIALVNLEQARHLHQLTQVNLERQEAERRSLAHALHDEVLSRMAVLAMYAEEETVDSPMGEVYEEITARLRRILGDLRPAMLTYGLRSAIEEMLEDLQARIGASPRLILAVPESTARHPTRVEEQLFRIVQQAVENALRHAEAAEIRVAGQIAEDRVSLMVTDDGVGFAIGEDLDLASLLAEGHYGLAGMFERAGLVGAQLTIESAPGRGMEISLDWAA
jgi:signal transduction histidine kinase